MKASVLFAIACAFTAQAHANNAKCRAVTLTDNTHPNIACPDYAAFCTTEALSGDMTMESHDRSISQFNYNGPGVRSLSDVGQVLFNSYSSPDAKMHMELRFEDDGNYPARRVGGYTEISLSTGIRGESGVYVSQLCRYDVK